VHRVQIHHDVREPDVVRLGHDSTVGVFVQITNREALIIATFPAGD
jgi:hypothetical protein